MLETISKKSVLIGSLVLMSVMFTIVMFFVNPQIDGSDGIGIIKLQLSFSKEAGIGIIYG
jgi:regulatory protein YycH of two-component signal transduction system YycFG